MKPFEVGAHETWMPETLITKKKIHKYIRSASVDNTVDMLRASNTGVARESLTQVCMRDGLHQSPDQC
jgi:hypothetical protein